MGTVGGHLGTNTAELCRGAGHHHLEFVVSPLADGLVLGTHLGGELGAATLGFGTGVGGLLVEQVDGLFQGLAGSLGVLLNLGGVRSHVLVGLRDASVDRGLVSGHGLLLSENGNAELACSMALI